MKLATTERTGSDRKPHAGINSGDEVYMALEKLVEQNKLQNIVVKLGRGTGSNMVRFGLAVAAEAIATGHLPKLVDSELTLICPNAPKPAAKK